MILRVYYVLVCRKYNGNPFYIKKYSTLNNLLNESSDNFCEPS